MLHDSNHIKNILFASKQSVNIKHEVSIKLLAGLASKIMVVEAML